MRAYDEGIGFKKALLSDPKVKRLLSPKEMDIALDPSNYLGAAVTIVDDVVSKLKGSR